MEVSCHRGYSAGLVLGLAPKFSPEVGDDEELVWVLAPQSPPGREGARTERERERVSRNSGLTVLAGVDSDAVTLSLSLSNTVSDSLPSKCQLWNFHPYVISVIHTETLYSQCY